MTSPPATGPTPPPDAATPTPRDPEQPRIWPALVVLWLGVPGSAILGGLIVVIVVLATTGEVDPALLADEGQLTADLETYLATPGGLALVLAISQLGFVGLAGIPAWLSKTRWTRRLGLVRGTGLDAPLLAALLVGTVAFNGLLSVVVDLVGVEPGETLRNLGEGVMNAEGATLVLLTIAMSVMPGFAEELVFRGYVQTRLLQRWPAWLAIGMTAFGFAAMHFDPLQSAYTLPIGVWLGLVAWRTGSIWPAIICHTLNNLLSVVMVKLAPGWEHEAIAALGGAGTAVLTAGLVAIIVAIGWWLVRRQPAPTA